jgi:hypothetical protein
MICGAWTISRMFAIRSYANLAEWGRVSPRENLGAAFRRPFRLSVVAGLLAQFAFIGPATADPVEIHYALVENLERVDVALLQSA